MCCLQDDRCQLSIMNTSHLVFKLPAVYEGTIFQIKKRIEICRPAMGSRRSAELDQIGWTKNIIIPRH